MVSCKKLLAIGALLITSLGFSKTLKACWDPEEINKSVAKSAEKYFTEANKEPAIRRFGVGLYEDFYRNAIEKFTAKISEKIRKFQQTKESEGKTPHCLDLSWIFLESSEEIMLALSMIDRKDLSNILIIDLAMNQLQNLNPTVFALMQNLRSLNLNRNKLIKLDSNTFVNLPNLEELFISNNQLTKLDSNAFAGLTKLKRLWLTNNQLTELDSNTFAKLANLEELYLCENPLDQQTKDALSTTLGNKVHFDYKD